MALPPLFKERMQHLLGNEAQAFFQSYEQPRHYGLRINTLKWTVEEALQALPFHLEPVPWAKEGFYFHEADRPAKHPYYHAGLYYIQEPSAMAPGAMIPIEPGDKVLDLCAAPGGKSTQIAARLKGKGVLVSNDISAERVKPLVKNLELFGVRNGIVTNETPERLAAAFGTYFDKIVIDAPCSGEGMFRKNPEMVKSWETHHIEMCTVMQRDILDQAARMLKPGGLMLYSTCTFAPEENEGQIAQFLSRHPHFEVEEISMVPGFQLGRPEWASEEELSESMKQKLRRTVRLWPHHVRGEGHFLALLRKTDGEEKPCREEQAAPLPERTLQNFREFEREVCLKPLEEMLEGRLVTFKQHLYVKPEGLPSLQGLKVVKSGWYLGELKKNRFEPSQALAMGLDSRDVAQTVSFSVEDEALLRYLKGETLNIQGEKGWKLVCVDRFPLGWGKQLHGILKNAYPPAWRWLA
ncbi:ribosomal RNA small subunit methyltransferase F [Caldalkalibacillus thermarum]|uniref:RsmF rRNA methyltransferase first C-terminal domain-containing protein n=1 Tax=Caldalkalibacillus thermarum TaxID=296745 RepID=UPI001663951B|nr:RsmB/NOP family class I SAM-dependent RNA methyltransferase [Caldalkalibacillus thermarum]GGK29394.1 ribosomal RNA small subunit methyltransferase F [Caldalkalibacillus thermarum]